MEEWNIQYKELLSMPEQSYRLIDIRDEASMSYGMIPGAEWLPTETIEQNLDAADKEKKLVLYCTRGALSEECAEVLREKGYDAVSLEGGYTRWLLERMEAEQKKEEEEPGEELLRAEEIEKSIRKKFHKRLFSRFAKAVREYELVQEGRISPALIIGAPVGFVNVVPSKELILTLPRTPYIVARGRKGGSNVAAALCNALLYQV